MGIVPVENLTKIKIKNWKWTDLQEVRSTYLESKGAKFENKLHGEEHGKYDIQNIKELSV